MCKEVFEKQQVRIKELESENKKLKSLSLLAHNYSTCLYLYSKFSQSNRWYKNAASYISEYENYKESMKYQ